MTAAYGNRPGRRTARKTFTMIACSVLAAGGLASVGMNALRPEKALASSHREAPLISGQPRYDNTDVYAFVSPDKPATTTLVANWIPFEDPAGGPNFYQFAQDAQYDLHIDSTGDGQSELIYRWTFKDHIRSQHTFLYNTGVVTSLDDADLNFSQTYDLNLLKFKDGRLIGNQRLTKDAPVAPSNVGRASMPHYSTLRDQAVRRLADDSTSFAGQADDPFFVDLRVFDLLYGGNLSETGQDTLKGYNVNSVALQVPSATLGATADRPILGIWSTTQRQTASGGWAQISRLGMPLVNEVVIPLKDKDRFNASTPWEDAQFARSVTHPELPRLLQKIYNIPAPAEPRNDLVQVFLTGVPGLNQPPGVRAGEELRLNTSISPARQPKRLGVLDGDNAGFPNGRRLSDDVLDISLQVVAGELVGAKNELGDGVDANDQMFGGTFPYLALPTSGSRGSLASGGADTGIDDSQSQPASALLNTLTAASATSPNSSDGRPLLLVGSTAAGLVGAALLVIGLIWLRLSRSRRRPRSARRG
ncbi:DUF4331 domain-containing protein [Streptomyces sp. NPDC006733]|uniref:DUF4331 domain-containing protein n=1 Tax=Streptomyces sp. NPDC006733 TaxID=3155460 RepID=UPI0033DF13A1